MTNSEQPGRPAVAVSNRPLHFIWICDCSGSMAGNKIQSLNNAIRESIPHMRETAADNPNAQVLVRALAFSDGVQWHISQPVPLDQFVWQDLTAGGLTDMGLALKKVAEQLSASTMSERGLPPVLVMISDGEPTDDFKGGLNALMATPWGKKAVRIAIAIGNEANQETLQKFIGNPEIRPLQANNPEQMLRFIKWASTATIQAASAPASQVANNGEATITNIPLPPPQSVQVPSASGASDVAEVW